FDLIVLSEVVYYLAPTDVACLLRRIEGALVESGNVVCVHYRGETDYPLTGDEANDALYDAHFLRRLARYVEEDFRLDVLERRRA
ncbi:MAG: methyltransferase type 12, partial [Polyangiaceae bacterium]